MSEALRVAEANRIDPKAVVEMLSSTLFAAPIYQNFGKLITGATGVELFRGGKILVKDVGLFQQTAQAQPTSVARLLSDLLSVP
jgi:3-hydroxyisobutyrate dehydrogenase-like beta-hydroxyacid dehydrogenase